MNESEIRSNKEAISMDIVSMVSQPLSYFKSVFLILNDKLLTAMFIFPHIPCFCTAGVSNIFESYVFLEFGSYQRVGPLLRFWALSKSRLPHLRYLSNAFVKPLFSAIVFSFL